MSLVGVIVHREMSSEGISEYRRAIQRYIFESSDFINPCDQIETDLFLPQNYVAGLAAVLQSPARLESGS
jgi:hypothetical protein